MLNADAVQAEEFQEPSTEVAPATPAEGVEGTPAAETDEEAEDKDKPDEPEEEGDLSQVRQAYWRIKIGGTATKKEEPPTGDAAKNQEEAEKKAAEGAATAEGEEEKKADADGEAVATATTPTAPSPPATPRAEEFATTPTTAPSATPATPSTGTAVDPATGTAGITPPTQANPPSDVEEAQTAPRELIFDSRRGDIVGAPVLSESLYQHSYCRVVLFDPEDTLRTGLKRLKNVEVEIGFGDGGFKVNKFVGILYGIGRQIPDGTLVEAIDPSWELKKTELGVVDATTVAPEAVAKEGEATTAVAGEAATPAADGTTPPAATATPVTSTAAPAATTPPTNTVNRPGERPAPIAEQIAARGDNQLQYVQRGTTVPDRAGTLLVQQSPLGAIAQDAAQTGTTVAVKGNTIEQTDPGKEESSGVVLDFKTYPDLIVAGSHPQIIHRLGVRLENGFAVMGADVAGKQTFGGIAVAGSPALQHPTGIINPPEWGEIKLSDPIIPGSPYTWADATKNGSRVPTTKEIMKGIIQIARVLTEYTTKMGVGKWNINSWYRDPATNRSIGGASQSRHMSGDAVDYFFSGPKYAELFRELHASWPGGIAKGSGFTHIDTRHESGQPKSRWNY